MPAEFSILHAYPVQPIDTLKIILMAFLFYLCGSLILYIDHVQPIDALQINLMD